VAPDAINGAIAEARRRLGISDRDVSSSVEHFAAVVRPVCDDWGLTAERWLDGGAGMPTLAVSSADGISGVLKISQPGALDAAVRVMRAAAGRGYVRVLAWDACRGALLTERLGKDLWTAAPTLVEQAQVVVPLLRDAWRVPSSRRVRPSVLHLRRMIFATLEHDAMNALICRVERRPAGKAVTALTLGRNSENVEVSRTHKASGSGGSCWTWLRSTPGMTGRTRFGCTATRP